MQTQSLPFETYRVHFKNSFCPCVKLFVVSVKLVVVVNPTSRSVPECPHVVKQVNVLSQLSIKSLLNNIQLVYYCYWYSADHSHLCILPSLLHCLRNVSGTSDASTTHCAAMTCGPWVKEPPHCLLLSSMALQSSDQERSRLWVGLTERCLLWQAVNRMCSHVGSASTPDRERHVRHKTLREWHIM